MVSNYTDNETAKELYYKVSFVTTHSENIPKKMKQTGALIVMDNVDTKRKSLWFRGDLIASGWGFISYEDADLATYFTQNLNEIFGVGDNAEGIFTFIPGYMSQNGPAYNGKSVYARLNDIWDSYTKTTSYFNNAYIFLRKEVEEHWQYLQDAYAYITSEIDRTYTSVYAYATACYQANWAYTKEAYTYLENVYAYLNRHNIAVYGDLCTYIQYAYNLGWETDIQVEAYCCAYAGDLTNTMHEYVDKSFERLIGGAPENLDTLHEIAYMLEFANQQGLTSWERLNDIQKTYVTHYPYTVEEYENDPNAYSYINRKIYALIPEAHTALIPYEEGPDPSEVDLGEWDLIDDIWYQKSYTYFTYTLEPCANLGMYSNQVSVENPFGNYPLTYILEKIVPPYKYEIPTIQLDSIQEFVFNNEIQEFGTTKSLQNVLVNFNSKDAKGSIKIKYANIYDKQTIVTTLIDNAASTNQNLNYYGDSKSKTHYYNEDENLHINLGNINYNHFPIQTLDSITVEYPESYVRVYPEVKDILPTLEDVEHVIPAGSFITDIFKNVKIPVRYRAFWTIDNGEITDTPIDSPLLSSWDSKLITNNIFKSDVILNENTRNVIIALPFPLKKYLIGIKIENTDTGISREIYNEALSSKQFGITTSIVNHLTENNTNIQYMIYKYSANIYYLSTSFRIVVEYDDSLFDYDVTQLLNESYRKTLI